jgi:heavy metal sensor kinase
MTLTRRLSLFFLAALAVVMAAFSVALYLLADRHLTRQLDDQLAAAARTLEPAAHPHAFDPVAFGDQLHWEMTTDDGRLIARSAQPGAEELLSRADAAIRSGHRNPRRFEHADRAWQVIRLRIAPETPTPDGALAPGKHPALLLTVAVPLDPVHATLRTLAATLAGLTLVILLVALFAARAVCRRALAPVARMADAARSMGAADLTERLPVAASADELADLGLAFNGLLDRLAEALERERRFAGEASHQLRTPLAALIGQVEVALRRERPSDEYRRALASVLDQAGRLRRVVESLLFLARSEDDAGLPGLERVELGGWIQCRISPWAEHPRAADLACEPRGEAAWAALHPVLFGELLDALLDNALKYSESGTPVTVRCGRDGDQAWIEVEDRGCGVRPDEVPHLFRPFFRSEATRKRGVPGAGLGLAVAARIAAAHGGSIGLESEPGRGSRFRVRLKAAGQPAPDLIAALTLPSTPSAG